MLSWGHMIETFKKRAARGERSESWDKRPRLHDDLVPVWTLWEDTHRMRDMTEGPRAWTPAELRCVLDEHRITEWETREEWWYLFRRLEDSWLEWARKKAKQSKGGGGKGRRTLGRGSNARRPHRGRSR